MTTATTDSHVPTVKAGLHEQLLALLRHSFQPLYAILDAARDLKVLVALLHSGADYQSLYEGPKGDSLAQVAPYLVRLPADSPLLDILVREGWGQSWGVYLTSASEFGEVRKHLRHFLEVQLPNGNGAYFRFYDPRVLRVYLPTCRPEETYYFFGPIKDYLVEDEKPGHLLRFVNTSQGSQKVLIALQDRSMQDGGNLPSRPAKS